MLIKITSLILKESVMSKPDNIKSVDEPKKDIQAKLNTKVEHDMVSDTSENIEEVKVLVKKVRIILKIQASYRKLMIIILMRLS